jgi:hypothetical protein
VPHFNPVFFLHSSLSTLALHNPCLKSAIWLKALLLKSILVRAKRIPILSLTLTRTLLELSIFVTRSKEPRGYNLQAQVRLFSLKRSPFAILLSPCFQVPSLISEVRLYQLAFNVGIGIVCALVTPAKERRSISNKDIFISTLK